MFLFVLVMVVTLICGIAPAFYATAGDLAVYLRSESKFRRRLFSSQEFLVGVQLVLALALVIGSGLLLRSMMYSIDFPVGWSPRKIVVVSAGLPATVTGGHIDYARIRGFFQDTRRLLSEMPGVHTSGVLSPIPFSADAMYSSQNMFNGAYKVRRKLGTVYLREDGSAVDKQGNAIPRPSANYIYGQASPDGFAALGVPIVAGRPFTAADVAYRQEFISGGPPKSEGNSGVAIINQELARRLWPGENAVGKIFYDVLSNSVEVVGVVQDFYMVPDKKDFIPTAWFPAVGGTKFLVTLRPGTPLDGFRKNVQKNLTSLAADVTGFEVRTLREEVAKATANQRLAVQLMCVFALTGLVVAGLGIYGTAMITAASRTRETGIRMALGAPAGSIFRLALWRSARVILTGMPIGLFAGWILARLLASYLVHVRPVDPLVALASCVLLMAAALAGFFPALKLSRTNPTDALRWE